MTGVSSLRQPDPHDHEASRADLYLASILDQAQVAIIATDLAGRVVTWNRGSERLFGYQSEEIVGQPLDCLDPQPDTHDCAAAALAEMVRWALDSREAVDGDTICRGKSGALIDLSVSVAQVLDDRSHPIGLSIIARDVSQQRRAEVALRDATRQRDVFLAMMSHELRTPLTTIIGYTDMLLRGLAGPLQPRGETYLGNVKSAGHRLLGLVEGLLEFSRLEGGQEQLQIAPIDVKDLVQRAVDRERSHAEGKSIDVSLSIRPDAGVVMADDAKLLEVLAVYLTNALKFTPVGGHIEVIAEHDPQALHMARIGVRDTGIGLSPDHAKRVWERFYQVDSSLTREYGGLGLGLAIAAHLVSLHGGRVWAESPGLEQGSTFWVSLPRQPARRD